MFVQVVKTDKSLHCVGFMLMILKFLKNFGEFIPGVRTGKCPHREGNATRVCEIYAWCPVEKDNDFPM